MNRRPVSGRQGATVAGTTEITLVSSPNETLTWTQLYLSDRVLRHPEHLIKAHDTGCAPQMQLLISSCRRTCQFSQRGVASAALPLKKNSNPMTSYHWLGVLFWGAHNLAFWPKTMVILLRWTILKTLPHSLRKTCFLGKFQQILR